ncbi:histidine kinase [Candidatus Fermentibacteria bacterium]|nr:histidine kinase [Candidatus Fermentibacteria bacterium]
MTAKPQLMLHSRYGMRTDEYSSLMGFRVRDILMVASEYDAFILQEDGQLSELVLQEYRNLELNVRFAPRFTLAGSGREAMELLEARPFDLIITTSRIGDMDAEVFGRQAKKAHAGVHVALLAAHAWDLPRVEGMRDRGAIDWVFLWQGDIKIFLAMIKQVEDRENADHDVLESGVQVIILVEDEVRFFSSFLPQMYAEVTRQTGRLLDEGFNLSHRLLRTRARPKILLAHSFEEALGLYERYAENVLGVISDVSYSCDGHYDGEAGLKLARLIRERDPDMPILLQSTDPRNRDRAHATGASFLHKESPRLLEEIRDYIMANFGFGDFVFRMPDGRDVGRACTIREMVRLLRDVPEQAIEYHARRNHFSRWLKARSEFELASLIKPKRVSEFASIADLRSYLIERFVSYLREIQRHIIADFDPERYDDFVAFAKIGSGSLGGKGRGLAFMHKLLAQEDVGIPGVTVCIPDTVVVASDVFEEFVAENDLRSVLLEPGTRTDGEILDAFRRGRFSGHRRAELAALLTRMGEPLAVRSSSILEDSVLQPFAGVYATVMLPNSHPSLDVRLAQLIEAIKVVYSSTIFKSAREYLATTPHRIEEERMAVLVQRLVGSRRGDRFYPSLAGVALSYNFYPIQGIQPDDGVALVAMGLGKSVVEGRECLRFCPARPQIMPQFSRVADVVRNAQRRFYALDMTQDSSIPGLILDANLAAEETVDALRAGAADALASTYLSDGERLVSGVMPGGAPLVTFAGLLEGFPFSLPALLARLLKICTSGFGTPVEIEFAADVPWHCSGPCEFQVLQVRPMVAERAGEGVDFGSIEGDPRVIVQSDSALGNGRISEVHDVIAVDPTKLNRAHTGQVAGIIQALNRRMQAEDKNCVLIGPGRWGSSDPWLGIPVAWHQISTARAIVETDFPDLEVEPSLGSHFFNNLTTFGIAYFTVHQRRGDGCIDWEWLSAQPSVDEHLDGAVRHLRVSAPLQVLVDGRSGRGAIIRDA